MVKTPKSSSQADEKALIEALRLHIRAKGEDYLNDPNITSVGIALKNGDGPVCLQFTVGEKGDTAIESLSSWRVPEALTVGGYTVPTDVVQRTYKPAFELVSEGSLDGRRVRQDPISPGISVGHPKGTAGTIGLIVYDADTSAPCILSNWHVLHGDRGSIGDKIVQPGPADDNNVSKNECGVLLRSHLGAAGDCALAQIKGRQVEQSIYDLGTNATQMARVSLRDKVIKSGRTTAVTYGIVRAIDKMAKIDYGGRTGVQAIGCFEIGIDPDHSPDDGEISKNGDSGSAWLIAKDGKATDIFAGLHFGGEAGTSSDEHAVACYPASIQKKLNFRLQASTALQLEDSEEPTAVPRTGYDPLFLGVDVPLPSLSKPHSRDTVKLNGRPEIPYTHFSVYQSISRRMPRLVAWNIDGARKVTLPRGAFRKDRRIAAEAQLGDDFYVNNTLDKGHVARRDDLCWGTVEEAKQANKDSFYYTNIAPQHERFNQSKKKGLWGQLENLILEQAIDTQIRASLFGGPIFTTEDTEYRGARVPHSYWKLAVYLQDAISPRCAAFILTQTDLLSDLETLDLDPFRLFQVPLSRLSSDTGLDFERFEPWDAYDTGLRSVSSEALDSAPAAREIKSLKDVRI